MSNMSYCAFENTYGDLEYCADHILDKDLSKSEKRYRKLLVDLCRDIVLNVENNEIEEPEENEDG